MFRSLVKPNLLYLSVIAFVLNLSFAFQIANLSSIFKFLGAGNSDLPLLWLVPPITGLIVQPLVGQISDDTVNRYGKRRPYIFGWGMLAALSFIILPFTNTLFLALFVTWIIDCSLNGGSECLRALTADLTFKDDDRSKAFALQAFFSGIGSAVGAALPFLINKLEPYLPVKTFFNSCRLPFALNFSLILIGIVLVVLLNISIFKIKEKVKYRPLLLSKKKKPITFKRRIYKIFADLYQTIRKSPLPFKKICFAHAMTWAGIFVFWLYFTVTLAQNFFHLPPISHHLSPSREYTMVLQNASLNASYYFSLYQYVSVFYAVLLYFLSNTERSIYLHTISLLIGGISVASIGFLHDPYLLWFACVGVGIMWGSMIILPYSIAIRLLPRGRLGTYLGIFNICITAPQLICGLTLKPIYLYVFQGKAGYLLVVAGVMIVASAAMWFRVYMTNLGRPIPKPKLQLSEAN